MKLVRTLPRFKCDFCKYRSTKAVMEKHEKRCYRNPNRYCDFCDNKGSTREHLIGNGIDEPAYYQDVPCPYCSKFDAKIKEEIEERERQERPESTSGITSVPF